MLELISTIALICQVNTGSISYEGIKKKQKECYIRYLACVDKKSQYNLGDRLKACVVEKTNRES